MPAAALPNGLFAIAFGPAVDVEGGGLVILAPGARARSIEDVIGRVVHQPGSKGLCFGGQDPWRGCVNGMGEFRF